MAMTLIVKGTAQSSNGNGFTTSAFNSTGADLVVVMLSKLIATTPAISDNKGSTYTGLTQVDLGPDGRLFYAKNVAGASGHTLTVSGTSNFSAIAYYCFSGSDLSAPFDVENGAFVPSGTSVQTGSVTPSQNGSVIVTGSAFSDPVIDNAIDSGFSTPDQLATIGGTAYGVAGSYLIQGTAGAVNPTWSWGSSRGAAAPIAVFKPASGGVTVAQEAGIFDAQRSGAFTGLMWQ